MPAAVLTQGWALGSASCQAAEADWPLLSVFMGVLSLQDCRVGKGKRDRRAAGHSASHGAPFCQLNYLILGWL